MPQYKKQKVSPEMMPAKLKVQISLLIGLIYWGAVYILLKIDFPSLDKFIPILIYDILPFVLGFGLIILIRGQTIGNILYCPIILIVYSLINLLQNYFRLPEPYDPIAMTWQSFRSVGYISLIISVIGGTISLFINKKFLIRSVPIENVKA
jgi:hypothetical protein